MVVELPIGETPETGYPADCCKAGRLDIEGTTFHVNGQFGQKAAAGWQMAKKGLIASNAKLADGRPVWSTVDVLRFVGEALWDASEVTK